MNVDDWIRQKIRQNDYAVMITQYSRNFSTAERQLLAEILHTHDFDVIQAQALANAVLQQSRFNPDELHFSGDDDEDNTGVCPHCLNPPIPPLRDYQMWRGRE
ncbi:hypothetical protein [Stenoxybacter acetivorans]|uniref:hypothetical protein n=1 Tax=Stenoxybacter acetivorans TaxID=422441 RepID=UPI00055FC1ED|nr:hypothetical protein [Stenoxybacter acetivorans]